MQIISYLFMKNVINNYEVLEAKEATIAVHSICPYCNVDDEVTYDLFKEGITTIDYNFNTNIKVITCDVCKKKYLIKKLIY